MKFFGNIITAMVTPFTSCGHVNFNEACRLADYLIENGSSTLLLAGTTGESSTMSHEEELVLFSRIVAHTKGRARVMANTGSNCTKTAIHMTKLAEGCGVDGILQVVPYYNKPSQNGLYQHFKAIAEATTLPIMLYNIPSRTSIDLLPNTVANLSQISNIIGIKEASGSEQRVKELIPLCQKDFLIYSGDDSLLLPSMRSGAVGIVSVASHVVGKQIESIISDFNSGKLEKAENLFQDLKILFDTLFIETNPCPIKYLLSQLGFKVGLPRPPLSQLSNENQSKVRSMIEMYSLVPSLK